MGLWCSRDDIDHNHTSQDYETKTIEAAHCGICFTHIDGICKSTKICSNKECKGIICVKCAKNHYTLEPFYKGKLQRSKILCVFCALPIDPQSECVSSFIKHLFIPNEFKENDKIIAKNIAEMLYFNYNMWVCDSPICKNMDKSGYPCIFKIQKLACQNDMKLEELKNNTPIKEQRICQACTNYELTHDLSSWKKLGFIIDSGIPARKCPGCNEIYERDMATCPRIQCTKCNSHFCHCCGERFIDINKVYEHLNTTYATNFPTNAQIKEYLGTRRKVKQLSEYSDCIVC
jgi:hypothetical protein